MVKIRLKRMGAHKKPFYRVVVADSRNARNGKFIEELGYYDPLKEPPVIKIDVEKAKDWISKGAQATDTVRELMRKAESGNFSSKTKVSKKKEKEEVQEDVKEEVQEAEETAQDNVEISEEAKVETTEENADE